MNGDTESTIVADGIGIPISQSPVMIQDPNNTHQHLHILIDDQMETLIWDMEPELSAHQLRDLSMSAP